VLGLPVHDNWWQTETGCIMMANFAACELRPGSMGRSPARRRGDRAGAGRGRPGTGHRAKRRCRGRVGAPAGLTSIFRGHLHDNERYDATFGVRIEAEDTTRLTTLSGSADFQVAPHGTG